MVGVLACSIWCFYLQVCWAVWVGLFACDIVVFACLQLLFLSYLVG